MLLVVSLDSVSLPWFEELLQAGELPVLAALQRTGHSVPFKAVRLPGVAYPTLYGGLGPLHHGLYFPFQWSAADQRVRVWSDLGPDRPQPESIFTRIDRARIRMVVLDPPECTEPEVANGFVGSGIQFRSRVLLSAWSRSSREYSGLARSLGPGEPAHEVFGRPTPDGLLRLRDVLLRSPARLEQAVDYCIKVGKPELLWMTWPALHVGGHQFLDQRLLADRPLTKEVRDQLHSTLPDVLRAYDRMLGRVLDMCGPRTDVLIFYAKGMGPTTGWVDVLPEMLDRVMTSKSTRGRGRDQSWFARNLIPRAVRSHVADLLPDQTALRLVAFLATPRGDWNKRRVFALPSDSVGFVRVNRLGRERHGTVIDRDVAGLLDEVSEGLRTFVDQDGEPCVAEILRPGEVFGGDGPRLGDYPDLMVFWSKKPTNGGTVIRSPRFGELHRGGVGTGRAGQHCEGALAIVVPGSLRYRPPLSGTVDSLDVPATILSALGLSHQDLRGSPLLVPVVCENSAEVGSLTIPVNPVGPRTPAA